MPQMFRFTIRDMLWLVMVIGLAVGWWVDRQRILQLVRRQSPMLYEAITGEGIDTNDSELKARFKAKAEEEGERNNQEG
jgi:hypothetical protein